MSILLAVVLVIIGFVLLIWSADVLVDNASELANKLGVSTFLIGVVIVGFGTSAPELFVSAMAAMDNKGNLALGNALGSNITNIGMVLGAAAIVRVMTIERRTATHDIPAVLLAGLVAVGLLLDGQLGRIDGLIFLLLLVAYLAYSAKTSGVEEPDLSHSSRSTAMTLTWTIASIVILMAASRILVLGAVTIAEYFNVSELVIGLTIVAIGTSLPELAAAIAAARKGVHQMIIGNIVGSNVFNTLGVLGLTGVLRETNIDQDVMARDFPVMFAFTLFILMLGFAKGRLGRIAGSVMLIGYAAYVLYLIASAHA